MKSEFGNIQGSGFLWLSLCNSNEKIHAELKSSINLYWDWEKMPIGSAICFLNVDLRSVETTKLTLKYHLFFRLFKIILDC